MPGPEVLEIIEPGLLATVQDAGRPGLAAEGVTHGGAADTWSLAVANALVGNPPGAAAIELTLAGAVARALVPATVGLAGTIGATLERGRRAIAPGTAVTLAAGDVLRIDGPARGARADLALAGGVSVPVVLGSRSTALGAGFGGFEGRALRAGDRLRAEAERDALAPGEATWPGDAAPAASPVRILPGPHLESVGEPALAALLGAAWTVAPTSDRVGLRLDGHRLPGDASGALPTLGVIAGAIQLPPDGGPIVLLADHQPTGGYPVVAVVISADVPRLGQLAPGAALVFALVSATEARDALLEARATFERGVADLRADGWDDLWRWARG